MASSPTAKEPRKIQLTNSMSGKREEFEPAVPGEVTYYSCGPTVYGPLHIGNARALVVGDLIHRWLKHAGYRVNFVRNYTDVDDKIIHKATELKVDPLEVSEKYIDYCEEDIRLLGLQAPTKTVKVTDTIPEIIAMIERIIKNNHAYVVSGEVLFSIESFEAYGKLSGKNVEDLKAGARVEVDAKKRSPMDFSLWKPHKEGEPFWESPWGRGRPGWHIECSAMIERWLGETIDLHHGGQDLMFPHHENEIAQSEAAHHKKFCGFWVHHAFITSGNEKMSKSLGNILPTREFIERYSAELLKYIFLSFHYRSPLPYTEEMMEQAIDELERIYRLKKWAESVVLEAAPVIKSGNSADSHWQTLAEQIEKTFAQIEFEMALDMNTPGALGHVFSLIRDVNRAEAQAAKAQSDGRTRVAAGLIELFEEKIFPLFNVFALKADEVLEGLEKVRAQRAKDSLAKAGVVLISDDEIERLVNERAEAKKNKNFARADEIRKILAEKKIELIDSPSGTTWKLKG